MLMLDAQNAEMLIGFACSPIGGALLAVRAKGAAA
jgi:hypothetical protein